MVPVREHASRHDDPEDLPLISESARVVDVTPLDHNRTAEVRPVAGKILDELGRADLVDGVDPIQIDWEGVTELLDGAEHDSLEEKLEYLRRRYRRAYPSLLSIRVREEDESIDFLPGQYLTVRFRDTPRPYSVASSPNRAYVEFCVRRVPGGRLTSELFEHLDPGDELALRGPNGDFVMEDPSSRDIVFLATGTGVAPLKSMIQYTFEEGRDVHGGESRDVWLFLGSSWKDDLPYLEQFRTLANERENFHFVPTLSREEYLTDWDGETDYVQQTFVKYLAADAGDVGDALERFFEADPATGIEARIDPDTTEVYACGISAMVEQLVGVVQQVGVPEEYVHCEKYG